MPTDEQVATLRRFHRVVTERVGALDEGYLARPRPLAASRLLWEIGDAADVRDLRTRLEIDSGYLTRLLGQLRTEGLVEIGRSRRDARVRTVRPTAAGRAELAVLDQSSDALARSLLDPLNERQLSALIDAAHTVERLFTAGLVRVESVDPDSDDARFCVAQYFGELAERFEGGFDPATTRSASGDEVRPPAGLFLVASLRGEPIGCGGLKFVGDGAAEIKRMWVAQSARGLGVGRRLLTDLEQAAHASGATRVRLDTNRALREAIAMYRSSGYVEVPAFNDEPFAHHWFEKQVGD
ncbi:MAG: helix-turn-helix domain-containing GNAT family N-acetyltransferase [Actinomycetota bacterium]